MGNFQSTGKLNSHIEYPGRFIMDPFPTSCVSSTAAIIQDASIQSIYSLGR